MTCAHRARLYIRWQINSLILKYCMFKKQQHQSQSVQLLIHTYTQETEKKQNLGPLTKCYIFKDCLVCIHVPTN